MRKATLLTCMLVGFALSACTSTQTGQPILSGAAGTASSTPAAFTDINSMAVALKAQSSTIKTAHIILAMSTPQGEMNGQGNIRLSASDLAEDLTMSTPAGEMSLMLLPDAFYMKMPGQQLEPGKPWFKISLDGTDQLSKVFGAIMRTAQDNSDVTKSIEKLKDAGSITKSTKEQLDGTDVTHYWITVDIAKMMAAQTDQTMKDALQKAIDSGVKTTNYEIWINKDNLPVKLFTEMKLPTGTTTVTTTYSNWGKPVNITAPPADQVGQLPKLGG